MLSVYSSIRICFVTRYYSRFPPLKLRGLHRGTLIAQSFHVYLLSDRSWDEHRLQGRVQINIKLNYNDSVYQGAAHSRALHRQPLFAMDGTNPATARLVIFYAMYINTAMPRGRVLVCTCSLVAAFTPLSQDAGDTSTRSSRRQYRIPLYRAVKRHYEPMASTCTENVCHIWI